MKKTFYRVLVAATCLVAFLPNAHAREQKEQKIRHVVMRYIFELLQDFRQGLSECENLAKRLKAELDEKQDEIMKKVELMTKDYQSMSDEAKAKKEKEVQEMYVSLQSLQKEMQERVEAKQTKLLKPVQDRVLKSLESVSKREGIDYVFSKDEAYGAPVILYAATDLDISDLILKDLGVDIAKEKANIQKEKDAAKAKASASDKSSKDSKSNKQPR